METRKNPAFELADLLEVLSNKAANTYLLALGAKESDRANTHMHAMGLLYEVERACEAVSTPNNNVAKNNSDLLKGLWSWLVMPEANWGGVKRAPVGGERLGNLRNLGGVIDAQRPSHPSLSSEDLESLRVAFEKIGGIVDSYSGVAHDLRNYVNYVVRRGLAILDGEHIDVDALRSVTFEVFGASSAFASVEDFPKESRQAIFETATGMIRRFTGRVAVEAAGQLVSGAVADRVGLLGS